MIAFNRHRKISKAKQGQTIFYLNGKLPENSENPTNLEEDNGKPLPYKSSKNFINIFRKSLGVSWVTKGLAFSFKVIYYQILSKIK